MSFVSQIMRKASIVERSEASLDDKKKGLKKLVEEARTIRERMAGSFKRLTPHELETLGPARQKEIEQLTETIKCLQEREEHLDDPVQPKRRKSNLDGFMLQ